MTIASNIHEEISDLRAHLEALPEHLRSGPFAAVYQRRLDLLLDEAAQLELRNTAAVAGVPALDLKLTRDVRGEHQAPAFFVGELLQRWQALFSALGQAAVGKPTSRGVIPADILQQTTLDVVAFAPGSFIARMVLHQPDQAFIPGTELGLHAFEEFQALRVAGGDHAGLTIIFRRVKGRVLSAYGKLLQLLASSDFSLDVRFAHPRFNDLRTVALPAATAREILPALGAVSAPVEENEETFVGLLNAANRRTGTFEIDLGEEGTIGGRVARPEILDGIVIGRRYMFRLCEVVTRDPLTDTVESSWVLEDAQDQDRS